MNNTRKMAKIVYDAMEDKLAKNVRIIDISNISVIADYFIIADGSNRNQVQAIADNVEEFLGKEGYPLKSVEGYQTANWVLMDFNDVIVHIFHSDDRSFYDLERIWRDGKEIAPSDL